MESDARLDPSRATPVQNSLGQFSIWPGNRGLPKGWVRLACTPADDPLAYIEANWTQMGPSAAQRVDSGAGTLHGTITRRAQMRPTDVAVSCGEQKVTYAELEARASKLALRLESLGVARESVVAIRIGRGIELIVAILAVLKAGGAYLPIDPAYPSDRADFMLEDSGARVLVTSASMDVPTQGVKHVVHVEEVSHAPEGLSWEAPGACGADLAYIIYTSGSTGRPKGVLVDHHNVLRLFTSTDELYGFGPDDTWLLFHSYAFDFSVWEIFGALLYGGRLEVAPLEAVRSPDQLLALLHSAGVTVLNQTPSSFFQLVRALEQADAVPSLPLRYVIFGGEALEVRRLRSWFDMFRPDAPRLVNMYGITETTVHVTHRTVVPEDIDAAALSPIGAPIKDLSLHVLDETLSPVKVGEVGELYVGGAGLARGYLNRPGLTASRFIPDPFSLAPDSRLYRSGDTARLLANGDIEYLGRGDNQVKLRGYRIELGEIEARLAAHASIDSAVVGLIGTDEGRPRLCAWTLARDTARPSPAALRAHLAAALPAFMVPAEYISVDRWPLTNNGKLDRNSLPRPAEQDPVGSEAPAGYGPLLDVIGSVLGRPVRPEDSFFASGGDSMQAVRITHLARKKGIRVTVADILATPTLGDLLGTATTRGVEGQAQTAAPIVRTPVPDGFVDAYPLTPMQATMVQEYERAAPRALGTYHFQQWFRLADPSLSPEAMERAIRHLVREEPVLRSRLVDIGGIPHQAILAEDLPALEIDDGTNVPAAMQQALVERVSREDLARPLASESDKRLTRYRWIALGPTSAVLFLSIHHAIDDGWGNQQFLTRLFELYEAYKADAPPPVRIRANSFRQHVALVHEARASVEEGKHWSRVTRELPVAPTFATRATDGNTGEASLHIDAATTTRAMEAARQMDVSLKALAFVALGRALTSSLRVPRIALAVVTNGRSDALDDPLGALGLFWNLVPTEVPLADAHPARLARLAQERLVSLDAHALYPAWGDLQDDRKPVCAFNFLNFHNRFNADGMAVASLEGDRDKFHLPLSAVLSVGAGATTATIHFDGDPRLFDDQLLASLCRAFHEALDAFSGQLLGKEESSHA